MCLLLAQQNFLILCYISSYQCIMFVQVSIELYIQIRVCRMILFLVYSRKYRLQPLVLFCDGSQYSTNFTVICVLKVVRYTNSMFMFGCQFSCVYMKLITVKLVQYSCQSQYIYIYIYINWPQGLFSCLLYAINLHMCNTST